MSFDPSDNYDDSSVCISVDRTINGHDIRAYSSPDSEGRTYFPDGGTVGGIVEDYHGAPFKVDIVIESNVLPTDGEMQRVREKVGDLLSDQFDEQIDSVYQKITESDDPLEAILELEPDDL